MPKEYTQLKDKPEPYKTCPYCGYDPFRSSDMRGMVQSDWRKLFRLPYCAVICNHCHSIVGHEKP